MVQERSANFYALCFFFNPELCRELNFVGIFRDKAFNKSIIRNVTVQDEELCQWKCFLDDICKSYNFGPPQVGEEGKRVCELSSSHHVLHPEYLVSRPGFIHRSSVVRLLSRLEDSEDIYFSYQESKTETSILEIPWIMFILVLILKNISVHYFNLQCIIQ